MSKIVTITEDPRGTILRLRHENLELEHRLSYLTEAAIRVVDLFDVANRDNAMACVGIGIGVLPAAVDDLRGRLVRQDTPPALPGPGGTTW